MAGTIGVDVGGTKVAAGVVDEHGGVLATALRETPSADLRRTEDVIVDVVRELAEASPPMAGDLLRLAELGLEAGIPGAGDLARDR
jgi:predicted NBD/HSP70 family sugar kinase